MCLDRHKAGRSPERAIHEHMCYSLNHQPKKHIDSNYRVRRKNEDAAKWPERLGFVYLKTDQGIGKREKNNSLVYRLWNICSTAEDRNHT